MGLYQKRHLFLLVVLLFLFLLHVCVLQALGEKWAREGKARVLASQGLLPELKVGGGHGGARCPE